MQFVADFAAPTELFYVLRWGGISVDVTLLGSALLSAASEIAACVFGAK